MAHAASIDRLLQILREKAPDEVALADEKRRVRDGLLSVGLKLHCTKTERRAPSGATVRRTTKATSSNLRELWP